MIEPGSIRRVIRALAVTLTATLTVLVAPTLAARVTQADLSTLIQARDQGAVALREQFAEVIGRMEPTDSSALIADIIFQFGDLRFADGASEAALPAVEAALVLARRIGEPSRIASLDGLAGQMQYAVRRSPQSRARIEAAILQQRSGGRPLELARQLNSFASLLNDIDEIGVAMRLSDEALRLVTRHSGGSLTVVSFAVLYSRVELLRTVGDLAGSLAAAESLLSRTQRSGNREFIGTAQHALGRSALSVGDRKRAADAFETSHYTAKEFGDSFGQFLTAIDRIGLALDGNDFVLAQRWMASVAGLRTNIDDTALRGRYDLFNARLLAHQEQGEAARRAFERGREQIGASAALWLQALVRSTEADVLAAEGKYRESLATMRESMAMSNRSERTWWRNAIAAREAVSPTGLSPSASPSSVASQEARVSELEALLAAQQRSTQHLGTALALLLAGLLVAGGTWGFAYARRAGWLQKLRVRLRLRRTRSLADQVTVVRPLGPGPDTAAVFTLDRRRLQKETDGLTNLSTSAALKSIADELFARAARMQRPMSIVLLHVDDLGAVNRAEGFERGNALLKLVASWLQKGVRSRDRVGRWEGDEFVVILDRAGADAAKDAAARLHGVVHDGLRHSGFPSVSCSVGVATASGDESFTRVLARADVAMNKAKQAGRNQVVTAA